MKDHDLAKVFAFIQETENLKNIHRSGNTSEGRRESTAEHTWRLSLMVLMLADSFEDCDPLKLLALSLVHDLGELYEGDIPAVDMVEESEKDSIEAEAIGRLSEILPEGKGMWLTELWKEYNEGTTPEAKVVKALDKMETIIQHNQGDNPEDFDYAFNLDYGRTYAKGDELLEALRAMIDEMTEERIRKNEPGAV